MSVAFTSHVFLKIYSSLSFRMLSLDIANSCFFLPIFNCLSVVSLAIGKVINIK